MLRLRRTGHLRFVLLLFQDTGFGVEDVELNSKRL